MRQRGQSYTGIVGITLLAEVGLGLLPPTREWFRELFNADLTTSAVQLVVALVSLLAYRSGRD